MCFFGIRITLGWLILGPKRPRRIFCCRKKWGKSGWLCPRPVPGMGCHEWILSFTQERIQEWPIVKWKQVSLERCTFHQQCAASLREWEWPWKSAGHLRRWETPKYGMVNFYGLDNWISRRIIPSTLKKGWRYSGIGSPPTLWPFMVGLGSVMAPVSVSFGSWCITMSIHWSV